MSSITFSKPIPPHFGLPPPVSTANSPLLAHFLRQKSVVPTSLTEMPIIAPPTVPLDKNATSMRVLLHDTQANFENFATHVAKLIDGVNETKQEVKTTHSLFERDRESLMNDIIDLVNRSQKEIQKSIGTPSQNDVVEGFFKDIFHRLTGLEQRFEAIQAFNQSHSQALQTQIQAIQVLLDKQGSILTAVMPLLPLMQALPMHIDAAKSNINESLRNLIKPDRNLNRSEVTRKRKQDDTRTPSSPISPWPKRARYVLVPRSPTIAEQNVKQAASTRTSTPLPIETDRKDASVEPTSSPSVHAPTSRTPRGRRPTNSTSTSSKFSTPRRPLADLPLKSLGSASTTNHQPEVLLQNSIMARSSSRNSRLPATEVTHPLIPPPILRVQPSRFGSMARNNSSISSSNVLATNPQTDSFLLTSSSKAQYLFASNKKLASPFPSEANALRNPDSNVLSSTVKPPAGSPSAAFSDACSSVQPKGKSLALSAVLRQMKVRRSPVREGRRFIPLVDSDEEDKD